MEGVSGRWAADVVDDERSAAVVVRVQGRTQGTPAGQRDAFTQAAPGRAVATRGGVAPFPAEATGQPSAAADSGGYSSRAATSTGAAAGEVATGQSQLSPGVQVPRASTEDEEEGRGDAAEDKSARAVDKGPTTSEDANQAVSPPVYQLRTGTGTAYESHFGDMPVQDAMVDMLCQAAALGGAILGDKMVEELVTTEEEVLSLAANARALGDSIQVLYGPIHTIKLYRLMFHLADELRARGNLWEGDTSENEMLHKSCKKMFARSSKRGPRLALLLMRGDEAQKEVLREVEEEDSDNESQDDPVDEVRDASGSPLVVNAPDADSTLADMQVPASGRGQRFSMRWLEKLTEMRGLARALDSSLDDEITVANSVKIRATFEWGGGDAVQHVRAATRFIGKPWNSYILHGASGGVERLSRWGQARLVVRRVGRERRDVVVVWRMREVPTLPGCVLTPHGCTRLAWAFDGPLSRAEAGGCAGLQDVSGGAGTH